MRSVRAWLMSLSWAPPFPACEVAPVYGASAHWCFTAWRSHYCQRRPGHRGRHWCGCGQTPKDDQ